MINVLENKVLGPMIREELDKGRKQILQQGRQEGRTEALQGILRDMLKDKFGRLPKRRLTQIESASIDELQSWAKRVLPAESLDQVFQ